MPKNWPLLIKTAEHIIEHPESWDQSWYFQECGTVACFAGWAVMLEGYKPRTKDPAFTNLVELTESQSRELKAEAVDMGYVGADYLARNLLGLVDSEGSALFKATNDIIDILTTLDAWAFADGTALSDKLYKKLDEVLDAAAAQDGF